MDKQLIEKLKSQVHLGKSLSLSSRLVKDFINLYMNEEKICDDGLEICEYIFSESNLLKKSEQLSSFIEYIRYLLEKESAFYLKKDDYSISDIENILSRLLVYERICSVFKSVLDKLDGNLCLTNFLNSNIFSNYEDILLSYVNKNYLVLPNDLVDKIINSITYSIQFQESLTSETNSFQSRVFITKYVTNILPILEFVSYNFLLDDVVVKAILSGNVLDKDVIKSLFQCLSVLRIIKIFGTLSGLLDYLENVKTLQINEKKKIISELFERIIRERKFYLFKSVYFTGYSNETFKTLLESYRDIVNDNVNSDCFYDKKEINYMVDKPLNQFLVSNLMFLTKDINISSKYMASGEVKKSDYLTNILDDDDLASKRKKCSSYNLTGRMIRFNDAMEMLDAYFKGYSMLDMHSLMAIIRSIMHQFTTKLDAVLFGSDKYHVSKTFTDGKNIIVLNNQLLKDFLDVSLPMDRRLRIFQVMFNEYRFVMEPFFTKMSKEEYFDNFMVSSLFRYVPDYYETNYGQLNKNSNIGNFGVLNAWRFLRSFNLPFDISYFLEPLASSSELFESSTCGYKDAFLKLASYHSDIMEEYNRYQIYFAEMENNLKGNLVAA